VSTQTKRFERFVRACVDANNCVLGLCLCLFVSSTPVSPKRLGARVGLGHVSTKAHVPKISKDQLWKGTYVNYEYGYSLTIPRGLVGLSPPAPWPQHGIEIRLTGSHHAHVLTNADFSAVDYPSLDAAIDSDLREPRQNSTETQLVSRRNARLRSLEAVRVMVRYKEAVSGTAFVEETITAIRRAKRPEEGVLYTIRLVTPEQRYESDRRVLESILRSWRLRRLPQ